MSAGHPLQLIITLQSLLMSFLAGALNDETEAEDLLVLCGV